MLLLDTWQILSDVKKETYITLIWLHDYTVFINITLLFQKMFSQEDKYCK